MMGLLGRIFGIRREERGESSYIRAMRTSDGLLKRMNDHSTSTDAVRAVMSDIWAQHNNVPFMTTVVQSVEEIKSGIYQKPSDR